MNTASIQKKNSGFSLTEMLTVIAVIGVISAIAIPNVSNINESSKDATARRHAQILAAVSVSAQAAGLDFIDTDGDLLASVNAVIAGGQVQEGVFIGAYFGVPMSDESRDDALKYLQIADGTLVYTSISE